MGFTQPVAAERLMSVDMLPMGPVQGDAPTAIAIYVGGVEQRGIITNHSLDGKVYIKLEGQEREIRVDLATARYRWL